MPRASVLVILALIVVISMTANCATVRDRIPLDLKEYAGIARHNEPICCGIPLPRGYATEADEVALVDSGGRVIPSQRSVLARWHQDGSIRWLLIQCPMSAKANQTRRLYLGKRASRVPKTPLKVEDDSEAVTITTGPLKMELRRQGFRLPNQAWLDMNGDGKPETAMLRDERQSVLILDGDGNPYPGLDGADVEIRVEESGPYRAVIRCQRADKEALEGQVDFIARVFAYAGQPYVRLELTLINTADYGGTANAYTPNQGIKVVSRIAYRLWPQSGRKSSVTLGIEDDGSAVTLPADAPVRLRQLEAHSFDVKAGGGEILQASGDHAAGWVTVDDGSVGLMLSCKQFWQQYPKAVTYDPGAGQLALDLWAEGGKPLVSEDGNLEWYPGQAKTHDLILWFDKPSRLRKGGLGQAIRAQQSAPLRLFPPPEIVLQTDATDVFAVENWDRWPTFEARARSQMLYSEIGRYYGMQDFGDRPGGGRPPPIVAWWNGYHAPGHTWFNYYFRSGDPGYFLGGEICAWHRQDVDVMHWPPQQAGMHHLAYYAGSTHHWGWLNWPGCEWIQGLPDYYFLTGNQRTLEVINECADWICDHLQFAPHRTSSISLIALSTCYQATGNPKHLDACKRLAEYLCKVVDEGSYVPKSFMIAHMIDGMYQYWRITHDNYVGQQLAKQCEWLYTECIVPSGVPYYARTGSESDANSWSVYYFCYGEMSAACAQAYRTTKDPKFITYGKCYLDYMLALYGDSQTGMMGHTDHGLPQILWAMEQEGEDESDIMALRDDIDYEAAIPLLKQHIPDGGSIEPEIARILIDLGRYDEAIEWMQTAMIEKGRGNRHGAMFNIARCYEAKADLDSAISTYKKIIRETKDVPPKGPEVGLQPWEVAAAMRGYSHAYRAWTKLGRCYEQQGDFRRAIDCYERAYEYIYSGERERLPAMIERCREAM